MHAHVVYLMPKELLLTMPMQQDLRALPFFRSHICTFEVYNSLTNDTPICSMLRPLHGGDQAYRSGRSYCALWPGPSWDF